MRKRRMGNLSLVGHEKGLVGRLSHAAVRVAMLLGNHPLLRLRGGRALSFKT